MAKKFFTSESLTTLVDTIKSLLDGKASASHKHTVDDVAELQSALDSKLVAADMEDRIGGIAANTTIKSYIDTAVGSGGTASAEAISNAKQEAIDESKGYTDTVSQNALVTVQQLDESVLADAKAHAVDLALAAGEDAKSWIATAKEEACTYTDTAVSGKADKDHTHDDRYYTETEVNNLLAGKANSSHGTHVSYSTTAPVMDGTASVGSATTVARSDHKHPTDTSRASQASLDSHTGNTTVHITSTERTNWNAAKTHADSAHAPSNAQPNQNAFSNVTVGSTTIAADTTTDTLTMEAGTGISVSADVTNDKVTITNSGVRSITTGSSNGTISVNTNGTSADVAVTGLGSAAYTASTAYDAAGSADTALASAKTYTDGKIDAIVGEGASETLDTIGEISAAITENQGMLETLNDAIGSKSAKTHTHTVSHTPAGDISETSITPAGTVSQPTFTGTAASHNHSFTGTEVTLSTDFTPAGSVSSTFTGTAASHNHSFTGSAVTSEAPSGTATVASSTHTHKYTPAGTVSQPTFTGSAVTSGASSGTTSVYSITGVGSVPSLTASVENQCLTITFSAGSVPTRSSVTLPSTSHTHSVTAAGTVSQPTFSGTEASTTSISGTATVAKSDHTHSVTAAGTVGNKSVTPAGTISSTFTGTEAEIAIDYTPAGTVGNKSITPAGTVSQPTFTGTAAKHKHTFTGTAATLTTSAANS